MSCDNLVQTPVTMNVTVGSLPEGYCPESYQALAEAIVARMIVTPSQSFSTFVTGSTAPTSNQGPWLRNCEDWYVWDDSTSSYRPITKGGFNNQAYYTSSDTFVVPDGIFKVRVHAWGAGGGGADNGGVGGPSSGGGAGAYGMSIVDVVPGQSINFTVGSGGAGGSPSGTAGGNTVILGMTAGGGGGGSNGINASGGSSGSAVGFTVNMNGGPGISVVSTTNNPGGSGGSSPNGGSGGSFQDNQSGISPGGGGGGCRDNSGSGGTGADGAVLIEW